MIVKQWKSQMKLEKEQLGKIPNWVPFYNYIASAVGKPLYADIMTESCARLSFVRICVQLSVDSLFPESIDLHFANGGYAEVLGSL